MTKPSSPQGPLSTIAKLSDRPLTELHRLFRLPGAPAPTGQVAQINVYDLSEAMEFLHVPPTAKTGESEGVESATPLDLSANQRPRVV